MIRRAAYLLAGLILIGVAAALLLRDGSETPEAIPDAPTLSTTIRGWRQPSGAQ